MEYRSAWEEERKGGLGILARVVRSGRGVVSVGRRKDLMVLVCRMVGRVKDQRGNLLRRRVRSFIPRPLYAVELT